MIRRNLLLGLALVTLATQAHGATKMSTTANPADTAAITAAIKAYETSWNTSDLDAMGRLYAPDVHWVNVRGMHWRGFDEVDRAHRTYFDIMFKGVPNDLVEIESITPVTNDVIVAVVLWRFGAFTAPSGQALPPHLSRMSMVYTRTAAGWKIAHGHNEEVDEAAQQFDPIRGSAMKR